MLWVYQLVAVAALAASMYVLGDDFQHFGDRERLRLSYLWFVPLMFGVHGVIAEWHQRSHRGRARRTLMQTPLSARGYHDQGSLGVALVAALFWCGLLFAFQKFAFPLL
jgi:hypothetical protein